MMVCITCWIGSDYGLQGARVAELVQMSVEYDTGIALSQNYKQKFGVNQKLRF